MSWGSCYFYYQCRDCGKKYKYAEDMIPVFESDFGKCPECGSENTPAFTGAITEDDAGYTEVER